MKGSETTGGVQEERPKPGLKRVVIAGGGTGGHLIPGLAVARELVAEGVERVVFVGTARGIEARMVPEAGFELRLVRVGGLKNLNWRRRLRTLVDLPLAVVESVRILRQTRAQVVLGIGGYASGPALAAAGLLGVPAVVLEVNAKSGLANRLAAGWVKMAAVTFAETGRDFRRFEVTGVPVREEFFSVERPRSEDGAHLLIFGGSQGARAINRAAVEAATIWKQEGWRVSVLHQTGAADYNEVLGRYREAGLLAGEKTAATVMVEVAAFIEDMPAAMARAGLVVCRSGASTLAELAAAGRAAVLIPFPGAADQHQSKNAEAYRRAGAACLLEQQEASGARLAAEVRRLLGAPAELESMEAAVRQFAHPRAAGEIARLLAEAAGLTAVQPPAATGTEEDLKR